MQHIFIPFQSGS